ncbi:hypothetical protein BT96DRAFT_997507 [Gymnopus androsaceus JB14]|uniref:Uncharacterized protein n=1 Tax=Gymnopus androsaceus JB14 TaxID=1447944 RepID=A0A6A4HEA7_9AGAR|nr:hypothetical protein BT96DRAFT_997507 [Gymnopus androsaceus JB14]
MLAAELHNAIIAGENQAGNPFDPLPAYHRESDSQPLQSSMIRDIPDIPTRQSPPAYNSSPRANSVPISLPESVSDIQDQSINRQQTLSGPGYLGPANAESTPWFGRVRNRRPDTEDPRGYETETDVDESILLRSMGVMDPAMERRRRRITQEEENQRVVLELAEKCRELALNLGLEDNDDEPMEYWIHIIRQLDGMTGRQVPAATSRKWNNPTLGTTPIYVSKFCKHITITNFEATLVFTKQSNSYHVLTFGLESIAMLNGTYVHVTNVDAQNLSERKPWDI